jgi:hypothetical protein
MTLLFMPGSRDTGLAGQAGNRYLMPQVSTWGTRKRSVILTTPAGLVGAQPMRGEREGSPLAINHFSYLKAEQTDRDAQLAALHSQAAA